MKRVSNLIFLGFFLRLLIAIWNGFFGPSPGGEDDALTFHLEAVAAAHSDSPFGEFVVGWIYTQFLGGVYRYIGDSIFLGSLLSCLTWVCSAYVLSTCMSMLCINKVLQRKLMLIYVVIPSSIMLTSITLREAYQLLFVNLAILSALKIYLKSDFFYWAILGLSVVGMGALHGALMAFGVLFILGVLLMRFFFAKKKKSIFVLIFVGAFSVSILIVALSVFGDLAYNLDAGLFSAVEKYQEGVLNIDARANYRSDIDISSPIGALTFIPTAVFQYLFEPMPWRISAMADIVQLMENCLRFYLIAKTIQALRRKDLIQKNLPIFLFFSYLVVEGIWSLGTGNWGTSIRHHIPAWGLLLLSYGASLSMEWQDKAKLNLNKSTNASANNEALLLKH